MLRLRDHIHAAIVLSACSATVRAQAVLRVDDDAAPGGNGASWATAFNNLQSAVAAAPASAELWVAAGTYMPTSGTDRAIYFELRSGLAIYGGFAGDELARDERDFNLNITTLSGNIGSAATLADNSYHVVACLAGDETAILDGCTITAGNADTVNNVGDEGGGIHVARGSPMIRHCTFTDNRAMRGGGAASIGQPTFLHCVFDGNGVAPFGFGGAGVYARAGTATFINCLLINNSASPNGFGGAAVTQAKGQLVFINCTIADNDAFFGGAMMTKHGSIAIHNTILWGNTPATIMGDITATYCDIEGANQPPGEGNINIDPQFVDASNGDFRLQRISPCVDVGSNALIPVELTIDLDGAARIQDGDADAIAVVDMGAFELPGPALCLADFVSNATFEPPPDGLVDGADLAFLLGAWGANPGSPADMVTSRTFQPPPDGFVDGADLATLLGNWGRCP